MNGQPFLGVELKDKPFTSDDVARAADTAMSSGLKSMLFISGRHTGIPSLSTYFSEVRRNYAKNGFSVGIVDVDEPMTAFQRLGEPLKHKLGFTPNSNRFDKLRT